MDSNGTHLSQLFKLRRGEAVQRGSQTQTDEVKDEG